MLDRDDLELIQRHLDGDLTPAEANRLETLLANNSEARSMASALKAMTDGLEAGAMIKPHDDAVAAIMAKVQTLPQPRRHGFIPTLRANVARAAAALKEMSGLATGAGSRMEDVMSSRAKIVMSISAAAIAVLIGVYMMGYYPPVDEGAATIGAAKRYQAPQIAAKDVKLGDTQAQAFMQSETFDRILKDPNARKMLASAEFREFFADAEMSAALQHPEFAAGVGEDRG